MVARVRTSLHPLRGLVVLDFSRVLAGPLCTQLLADSGARVIKIEEPGRGDETRRWGPPFVNGISAYFLSVNRNKQSMTLNLKSAGGRRIARELMARADVVVENFLPAQKASLRFPDPRRGNRRVIHCTISGFDSDTPDADTPGYDLLAQAGAGLMAINGEPDGDPMKVGVALSDVLTAHHAFGAICAALTGRAVNDRGCRLEISLFAATAASLVNVAQNALLTKLEGARQGNAHASIVPYQLFHASDRPFAVGVGTDRHYERLCRDVLGRPDLLSPRFASNAKRVQNRSTLLPLLEAAFRIRTASSWVRSCRKAGIPVSLVLGVLEALRSPSGNAVVETVQHAQLGSYRAVGNPVLVDGARRRTRLAPPALGADTDSILRQLLYSRAEIVDMRERGVV
ncbi:MAG: CoA transferase [Thermoanaerobaculia bacterium]